MFLQGVVLKIESYLVPEIEIKPRNIDLEVKLVDPRAVLDVQI